MLSLSGKVALITGASSGIGASTAVLFAELGAKVAITGRNSENLAKTADICVQKGCDSKNILQIVGDVCVQDDVGRMVDETVKSFGKLDCLVNNAGILEVGGLESSSPEQLDRVFDTNVKAPMVLSKASLPHLKSSKGSIVNVSSVNGMRAFPGVLAYNMSKAALDHFTRCTSLELAPFSVRVNSVNPGVTITDLHKRSGQKDEQYAAFLEKSKTTHPLGRPGTALEVANAIAFLASDASSDITGTVLPVDGGRHATCLR